MEILRSLLDEALSNLAGPTFRRVFKGPFQLQLFYTEEDSDFLDSCVRACIAFLRTKIDKC